MFHPLANLRTLVRHIRREIARSYLHEQAAENLRTYPQLCCYSFDGIGIEINLIGRCDREALDRLTRIVAAAVAGRTIVDVGANIGNHAIAFAEVAGSVIALEPHPTTYRLLEMNVAALGNVTALNVGASDAAARVRAVRPRLNYGGTAITDRPAAPDESEWTFEVAPIDSIEAVAAADIAMMKFDVEGHEPAALRGARQTILRHRPLIVMEQNAESIEDGSSEALEILKSYGYAHFMTLDTKLPWRSAQWLPGPVRKVFRLAEAALFGPPEYTAIVAPVDRLEPRSYPMLIASMEELGDVALADARRPAGKEQAR
jgi:FkbM family methyltransferase